MNEEQEKHTKSSISKPLLYLMVLIILLCVIGVGVMAAGGHTTPSVESFYYTAKTELQNAVNNYQNKNNGALPTINGSVIINGSTYRIINICPLLTENEESLQTVIESLWCSNGSNDDNWGSSCADCNFYSSYIWAVDNGGNVHSTCVGQYCNASGVDGYQDQWP